MCMVGGSWLVVCGLRQEGINCEKSFDRPAVSDFEVHSWPPSHHVIRLSEQWLGGVALSDWRHQAMDTIMDHSHNSTIIIRIWLTIIIITKL